jgi:hypothetical protein
MKDLSVLITEALSASKLSKAVKNAKDMDDVYNAFKTFYKVDDDELDNLFYLVHSDNHIYEGLKELINKIQKKGDIPKTTLYRGCSDKEYNAVTNTGKSPVETLSFSESEETAKQFGKHIITVSVEAPMFCYHEFLRVYYSKLKELDPEEYDGCDGDEMISAADEELEWICTNDYKFVQDGSVFKLTK